MKHTKFRILTMALLAAAALSCKKNSSSDPKPENPQNPGGGDEEIITRVRLQFTDSASTDSSVSFSYIDPDGDLGQPATTDTIKLAPGKTWLAEVSILNETTNPPSDISEEIQEEADYHRFHYTFTPSAGSQANPVITITDSDSRTPAQPLGLMFKFKTRLEGKGKLNLNLRHFADGAEKTGDPADGEQDILIDFPVSIR